MHKLWCLKYSVDSRSDSTGVDLNPTIHPKEAIQIPRDELYIFHNACFCCLFVKNICICQY